RRSTIRQSGMRMNRSKAVLVISYHFPPDGAVGGLRWAALGKYLAARGWTVHVITAAENGGAEGSEGSGVVVHRLPRRRTLNDVYNDMNTERGTGQPAT